MVGGRIIATLCMESVATFSTPLASQESLFGLPELVDRHSGDNIATHVVEVLRSYGITHK
ncbi:hypothetical protein NW769_015259, partial [Fusarium oxysporum]